MSETPNVQPPITYDLERVIELNTESTQQEDNDFASTESAYSPFQQYYEDQMKVDPKNKLKLLFCCYCFWCCFRFYTCGFDGRFIQIPAVFANEQICH